MTWFRIFIIFVCSLGLLACIRQIDQPKPNIHYPEKFSAERSDLDVAVVPSWWYEFESPILNDLIEQADFSSLDLQMANERVRQAELQMRIASASLFPFIDMSVSTGEQRRGSSSENIPPNTVATNGATNINLSVSYEVDVWGRINAGKLPAQAGLEAVRFQRQAANLSLRAAVANGWFTWLALQERMKTARDNIVIAERIYKIVDARYRNGVATSAEVAQQQTNVLLQKAELLPLEMQARQTQAALAILLGQTPQAFSLPSSSLMAIHVPTIRPGTPVELVTHRPDLAASESLLLAANADLMQARASLLPNIQLNASAGRSASEVFSLNPLTQTSGWSIQLAQTIFNRGRLVNQKRLSESRRAELLLQYHQNILLAFQEVESALDGVDISHQQELSQQAILIQAERSMNLMEVRYREGNADLLSLLDAQRSVFQARDLLVQYRQSRLSSAVDLYKALGG